MTIFGVHTGLQHTWMEELRTLWRHLDELGFGWLSVWDHFYAADTSGDPHCHEAVAAHAALALETRHATVGCLVYCVGYRHPAVLANAVATIDHLAGGRAAIGLGAGWSKLEYDAYGIPFPRAGVRLDMLEEAAACVRGLLRGETVTFSGEHFTMNAAVSAPDPVNPSLPIWIGGGGERRTLAIAARFADGWNVPFVSPEEFARKRVVLFEHCERVGRAPSEITCAANVALAWDEADADRQFRSLRPVVQPSLLTGSDQQVLDKVGAYVDAGADQVNVAVRAPWDPESLDRFASVVGLRAPV